jgi:hypothetical protein
MVERNSPTVRACFGDSAMSEPKASRDRRAVLRDRSGGLGNTDRTPSAQALVKSFEGSRTLLHC